jgi:hypothetical protein
MKTTITILLTLVIFFKLEAQNYKHDIGAFIGTSSLSSDYGESNPISTNTSNNSTSFAVAHYLQFYDRNLRWDRNASSRLMNHIMIKTEFRYSNSTNLQNFSEDSRGNSPTSEKMKAMRGSLSLFNLGTNLEYYLLPLRDYVYSTRMLFNPYISFGVNFSSFDRDITYDSSVLEKVNSLQAKANIPDETFYLGVGDSLSFSGALGTRIKVANNADIVTQLGYQYFLVDDLEGINANVPQNSSNDWLINFQFGLVYRL